MKCRYTFWVNKNVWYQFQELCINEDYQKNLVIENLIIKFIKENTKTLKSDIIESNIQGVDKNG